MSVYFYEKDTTLKILQLVTTVYYSFPLLYINDSCSNTYCEKFKGSNY